MDPDRWRRIEDLYQAAHDRVPHERAEFVSAAAEDDGVKDEVRTLLANDTGEHAFLARPAIDEVAQALSTERASLVGRRVGDYRLLSLLGTGGMGDVYRARDLKLDRDVALKVLESSVSADPDYLRRFEDEARTASGLNHPNIVTIYGVGDDRDLAYIAMELVEGQTLRAALANGALAIPSTFDLAVQFAEALSAAHNAGIVHRDLKPENTMVTASGLLKILDFGIAKRTRAGSAETVAASAIETRVGGTSHGTILGTAGYMSPEQAQGRPADARSDQFSLGAILYEMLTGKRAFARDTRAATLDAIISSQPTPLSSLAPRAGAWIARIVARCLAKNPDDRFPSTETLADELRQARARWNRDHEGLGVTRRRALWITTSAAAAALVGIRVWPMWRDTGIRSIAVLPFDHSEVDKDIDYVCDGVAEDLIRRIARLAAFQVSAFSLVRNFKEPNRDANAIGKKLGAAAVLTGTIARQHDRLLVTADLIDVSSGRILWRGSYDRPAQELVSIQSEIARAIVDDGIRAPVGAEERQAVSRNATENGDAYDCYLQALPLHRLGTESGYRDARTLLTEAVANDPGFALAYVSLASTYTAMAIDGLERPIEAWRLSLRHTRRALTLDPTLPEAHAEHAASLFFLEHAWDDADAEYRLALDGRHGQLLPDLISSYVITLWAVGRMDDAIGWSTRLREIDPVSPQFMVLAADLRKHKRDLTGARELYQQAMARSLSQDPRPYFGLAEVAADEGRSDEAIDLLRRAHRLRRAELSPAMANALASASGPAGVERIMKAAAVATLEELEDRRTKDQYTSPLDYARTFALLGDKPRAFQALDDAFIEGSPGLVFLKVDRAWNNIRNDAAFSAAVKLLELP